MAKRSDPAAGLVGALIDYQKERDLTDGALAGRIGVSRTLWVEIRRGRIPVTSRFASLAAAIPDIRPHAIAMLAPPPAQKNKEGTTPK